MKVTFLVTTTQPRTEEFDVEISASDSFEAVAEKILSSCDENENNLRVLIFGGAERVSALLRIMKNVGMLFHFHGRLVRDLRMAEIPSIMRRFSASGRYTMDVYRDDLQESLYGGTPF